MVNQSIPGAWDLGSAGALPGGGMLPSRVEAFTKCLQGLQGPFATAILTGDMGSGKSWLVSRIVEQAIPSTHWVRITLLPSHQPIDFYHEILLSCDESPTQRLSGMRAQLKDFLTDQSTNGVSWALCVEDLHHVSDDLLAELQLICRHLARPGHFRALLLAGNTSLTRLIRSRPFESLISRVGRWAHLRPIDADEAQELLVQRLEGTSWSLEISENLHRDSRGNPLLLLKLADAYRQRANLLPPPDQLTIRPERSTRPDARHVDYPVPHGVPLLGASKPPLRVEDGLIEVGYSSDTSAEPARTRLAPEPPEPREAVSDTSPKSWNSPSLEPSESAESGDPVDPPTPSNEVGQELVRDCYAAIQAWNEWSIHEEELNPSSAALEPSTTGVRADAARSRDTVIELGPNLWLEEQHESFAPYSQLFARSRPSKGD